MATQKKLDFIVCGTQKGGTKALDAYLREHPEVCLPQRKELHFFDSDDQFRGPNPPYGVYHAHFNPLPTHKVLGEGTPIYMYWNGAPRRMWQYNPQLKLILLLRNPIERAFSHWNMCREQKQDDLSFADAIERETERCRTALPNQHRLYSYIDRGYYASQIRRLWSFFPANQVLILKSEELKSHPEPLLHSLCDFLGITRLANVETKDVHSLPYVSKIGSAEKQHLRSLYEFDIRAVERMLGWDCSDWLAD